MKLLQDLKAHFRKTAQDMKGMTFQEKADHLWTYYKEYAFVVIMVIIIVGGVIMSLLTPVPKLVSSGTMVNVSLTLEGHDYLTDVFYEEVLGSPEGKVSLNTADYSEEDTVDAVDASYQSFMGVSAKVEARELDYMLMNHTGMRFYGGETIFMDLRKLLPEEDILQLDKEGKLVYVAKEFLSAEDLMMLCQEGRLFFPLPKELDEAYLLQLYNDGLLVFPSADTPSAQEFLQQYAQGATIFSRQNDLTGEEMLELYENGKFMFDIKWELAGPEAAGSFDVMAEDIFFPIAVDLTGMAYARDAIQTDMPVFLAFIENTPNFEACQKLWTHIKNWETRNQK